MRTKVGILAAALLSLCANPAMAGRWSEAESLCADALAEAAGLEDVAKSKLLRARDGRVSRVEVEATASNGDKAAGECRLRRGEIVEVTLQL